MERILIVFPKLLKRSFCKASYARVMVAFAVEDPRLLQNPSPAKVTAIDCCNRSNKNKNHTANGCGESLHFSWFVLLAGLLHLSTNEFVSSDHNNYGTKTSTINHGIVKTRCA